ncbi:hypothetical protein BMS3Bbin02_00755 [bacterium BMS3Bbin02]|nr:hypothetical protein BMS3Bbin02_00755 [bacterium BMS3Bbin02]
MTADPKPYLLMDVDGVLAPVVVDAPPPGFVRRVVQASDGREHQVWLNPTHGLWLNALRERFELVWASGWEHDAVRLLEPIFALPGVTAIEFTQRPLFGVTLRKLPDVVAFVGDMPVAWVDDDLDSEVEQWAGDHSAPTLLLKPDPGVGLTHLHIRELIAFSNSLAPGWRT